ncbi:MAG: cell shape determination protein CcmA [Gammaproteobacteria bacterium]|nr:cell shape determination protein CcmA [Gammaproteobacteria bacterium]|tara:strand:- start:5634 stop:6068 length:435 start_codon:yes stop_codon:yes gene_type:complete
MARIKVEKGVTLIAPNTEVVGDIRFKDQLYVNGYVEGNVLSAEDGGAATVIISEEGSVKGEIRVPNVVINGQVEGNVYASARVELAARARVKGNVYYELIEMQLGAMVDGQLLHEQAADSAKVHPFPAEGPGEEAASRESGRKN